MMANKKEVAITKRGIGSYPDEPEKIHRAGVDVLLHRVSRGIVPVAASRDEHETYETHGPLGAFGGIGIGRKAIPQHGVADKF